MSCISISTLNCIGICSLLLSGCSRPGAAVLSSCFPAAAVLALPSFVLAVAALAAPLALPSCFSAAAVLALPSFGPCCCASRWAVLLTLAAAALGAVWCELLALPASLALPSCFAAAAVVALPPPGPCTRTSRPPVFGFAAGATVCPDALFAVGMAVPPGAVLPAVAAVLALPAGGGAGPAAFLAAAAFGAQLAAAFGALLAAAALPVAACTLSGFAPTGVGKASLACLDDLVLGGLHFLHQGAQSGAAHILRRCCSRTATSDCGSICARRCRLKLHFLRLSLLERLPLFWGLLASDCALNARRHRYSRRDCRLRSLASFCISVLNCSSVCTRKACGDGCFATGVCDLRGARWWFSLRAHRLEHPRGSLLASDCALNTRRRGCLLCSTCTRNARWYGCFATGVCDLRGARWWFSLRAQTALPPASATNTARAGGAACAPLASRTRCHLGSTSVSGDPAHGNWWATRAQHCWFRSGCSVALSAALLNCASPTIHINNHMPALPGVTLGPPQRAPRARAFPCALRIARFLLPAMTASQP